MLGIRLYPHTMYNLLKTPSKELSNSTFELGALIGGLGHQLEEQIINSHTKTECVDAVVSFFKMRLQQSIQDSFFPLFKKILTPNLLYDVSKLKEESGLSYRQLGRKFDQFVGFSPKYLSRMLRFQNAERACLSDRHSSFTSLAYTCGYADQSHFNRELKEFSGLTPSYYFGLMNNKATVDSKVTRGLLMPKEEAFF